MYRGYSGCPELSWAKFPWVPTRPPSTGIHLLVRLPHLQMREQRPQKGHTGTPPPPPPPPPLHTHARSASRIEMAGLHVCKSCFFLDIYFHFVAVDKQQTMNSLYHRTASHISASLTNYSLRWIPRKRITESKGKPVFKTLHPLTQPSLASEVSGFLSHSV